MAIRTVTLSTMISEIRFLADVKGLTVRHPDADLTRAINQSIQRFREKVSNIGIKRYLTSASGTFTAGATGDFAFTSLSLSSLSPKCVRVYGLEYTINGRVTHMEEVDFASRNDFQRGDGVKTGRPLAWAQFENETLAILPASDGAYPYTIFYLPALADLVSSNDTFDGIAGWELWIQWDVLAKLITRDKYGQEYALCAQERELVWADIERGASPTGQRGPVKRYDARELRGARLRRYRKWEGEA